MPLSPARSATLPRCAVSSKNFLCRLRSQRYFSYIFPSLTSLLLGTSRHYFAGRVVDSPGSKTFPKSSLPRRSFSSTSTVMTATKIDGTAIAKSIREGLKAEIAKIQESNPRFKPSLVIFQVGNRSDSSTYVRMKLKAAEEVWI